MRRRYAEHSVLSDNKFLTVQIYPEYAKFRKGKRRTRYKPTSEAQKVLNTQNRFWKLVHLCNENFTDGKDLKIELTYSTENLPADLAQAKKDIANFKRRVNRACKKKGLPNAKCFSVIERGEKSGRYHHHIIISGGLSWEELDEIWGKGFTRATKLRFDKRTGLKALVEYMLKNPVHENGKAAYSVTRNLTPPKEDKHVQRLSQKQLDFFASYTDTRALEILYPDFEIVGEVKPFFNEDFGAFYFFAQMCRKERR